MYVESIVELSPPIAGASTKSTVHHKTQLQNESVLQRFAFRNPRSVDVDVAARAPATHDCSALLCRGGVYIHTDVCIFQLLLRALICCRGKLDASCATLALTMLLCAPHLYPTSINEEIIQSLKSLQHLFSKKVVNIFDTNSNMMPLLYIYTFQIFQLSSIIKKTNENLT